MFAGMGHSLGWVCVCAFALGCAPVFPSVPSASLARRILDPTPGSGPLPETEQPTVESSPAAANSGTQPPRLAVPPEVRSSEPRPPAAPLPPPNELQLPAMVSPNKVPPEVVGTPERALPGESIARPTEAILAPSGCAPAERLTLASALDLAYRRNPTLRSMRARVEIAESSAGVAYADFLPQVTGGYRYIAGDTDPAGFVLPTLPSAVGNVAFGGPAEQFSIAEMRAQWTIWDFGRIQGRYGQAILSDEIAQLQFERTTQTVAFETASAYFGLLAAKALVIVNDEAVRRAQSVLYDTRNSMRRGDAIRNDVLRAEVLLAEMQLDLLKARTAEGVSLAQLNTAMGIHPNSATQVADAADIPPFQRSITDCLQTAVDRRPEFVAIERGISKARLGENVADADFLPTVYLGGTAAHQDEGPPTKQAQHISGGVFVELGLFQGGRKIQNLRGASAEVKLALARGQEVCDQIAYEVAVAWLAIDDARQRIDVAQAAAAQASENMRVTRSLYDQGDAILTDVINAELTLTRAQQNAFTAMYDYQVALARLAYALGQTPEWLLAMPPRR